MRDSRVDSSEARVHNEHSKLNSWQQVKLTSPARNALVHNGIHSLQELAKYTEKEILALHGIGPASIPVMKAALNEAGLSFK